MSRKSKLSGLMQAVQEVQSTDEPRSNRISSASKTVNRIQNIALDKIYINPDQHRKYFDPDEQQKLQNAIQQNGFQGAILLRPMPDNLIKMAGETCDYELVYGESRYRAVKALSWDTIPAVIQKLSNREMHRVRLDENLVRKDLNPMEEVEGLLEVAADELETTPEALISLMDEVANAESRRKELKGDVALQAEKFQAVLDYYKKGTIGGFRAKYGKLRRLPEDIKQAVQEKLDWSKAVEIAPEKNAILRKKLLKWAIQSNPSVKAIRKKRKELKSAAQARKPQSIRENSMKIKFYKEIEKISESEEWTNPDKQDRIQGLLQEIEDIFNSKLYEG